MLAGPILAAILVVAITWMRRKDLAPAVLRDPLWQLSLVAALTAALMPLLSLFLLFAFRMAQGRLKPPIDRNLTPYLMP